MFGQQDTPVLVTFNFPTIRHTESNIQIIPPRRQQQPISDPGYNWSSRLNLSTTYVNRNLGNIIDTNERTIIQSFLFNNQNLPTELINILRVSNVSRSSATIYVPEGNLRYEGNLIVFLVQIKILIMVILVTYNNLIKLNGNKLMFYFHF
ncbi:MAG: hypothetical protein CXB60_04960 [Spiroplasma poulsonii]|nr:hypothetical protein [Spiroplasma poulsonii]